MRAGQRKAGQAVIKICRRPGVLIVAGHAVGRKIVLDMAGFSGTNVILLVTANAYSRQPDKLIINMTAGALRHGVGAV